MDDEIEGYGSYLKELVNIVSQYEERKEQNVHSNRTTCGINKITGKETQWEEYRKTKEELDNDPLGKIARTNDYFKHQKQNFDLSCVRTNRFPVKTSQWPLSQSLHNYRIISKKPGDIMKKKLLRSFLVQKEPLDALKTRNLQFRQELI